MTHFSAEKSKFKTRQGNPLPPVIKHVGLQGTCEYEKRKKLFREGKVKPVLFFFANYMIIYLDNLRF